MASASPEAAFIVWGIDQTPYGPVELSTLVAWVKDERVTTNTWIFATRNGSWQRAMDLPELKRMFQGPKSAASSSSASLQALDLGALRRIKILAAMSDEQLARFAQFIEMERFLPGAVAVREGVCDDTMYLVLEGELSVRMNGLDGEATLVTLGPGDLVGDTSLFDQGPRAVSVIANRSSVLIKISAAALQRLSHEAPELATPFLLAIGRTLTARIRAGNLLPAQAVLSTQVGE
jgi:hypothetical protein